MGRVVAIATLCEWLATQLILTSANTDSGDFIHQPHMQQLVSADDKQRCDKVVCPLTGAFYTGLLLLVPYQTSKQYMKHDGNLM